MKTRHVMTVLYEQPERHIPMFSHLKACAEAGAMDRVSIFSNTSAVSKPDHIARMNLQKTLTECGVEPKWYFARKNVGKAAAMNVMMDNASDDEIWFHMDSDIIISAGTMATAFELYDRHGRNGTATKKIFDILSLEQSDDRRHKARFARPAIVVEQCHAFHISKSGQGIAGGAMLIPSCKARYEEGSAYGGNEPTMYASMRSIYNPDFAVALCPTLVVVHPKDYNIAYTRWKRDVHASLRKKQNGPLNGYFD